MKRKLLALTLAAVQTVSLCGIAKAAQNTSLKWDFEDYTLNSDAGSMKFNGTAGENDKIEPAVITDSNGKSYGTSAKMTATTNPMFFDANLADAETLGEPYITSISYDMYTGDYSANRAFDLKINGTRNDNFIMIATNGTLKLNNSLWYGAQNLISQNSWNSFKAVLYHGTQKAEIYLNGTKIKDLTLDSAINTVNGFRFVDYANEAGNIMGIDNVEVKTYSAYDEEMQKFSRDFNTEIGAVSTSGGKLELKGGMGYKKASDKALYLDGSDETSFFRYNAAAVTTNLASPYVYHLSFETLAENFAANSAFDVYINGEANFNFIKYYADGSMTIPYTKQVGQWQKYDLYFYCGTKNCDLYVDGAYKKTMTTTETISYINGYGFVAQKGMKMAVDNISLSIENSTDADFVPAGESAAKYYDFADIASITTTDALTETGLSAGGAMMRIKRNYGADGLFGYAAESGKFGNNGKFYHISTKEGTYTVADKWGQEEELSVGYPSGFAAGDKVRFSANIAYSNLSSTKNITTYMNNVQRNDKLMLQISQNGKKATVFGTQIDAEFAANTWYNIDYIITVGDGTKPNTADVYIDGQKANQNPIEFSASKTEANTKLDSLRVGMLLKPEGTVTENNGYSITPTSVEDIYIDDVYTDRKTNMSQMYETEVSLTSSDINIKLDGMKVTGTEMITVADFLDKVTVSSGTLKVTDNSGNSVTSGKLSDYNIFIQREYAPDIYVKTEKTDKDKYLLYNDFDDSAINSMVNQNKQKPRFEKGVALKDSDNTAVFFDIAKENAATAVILEYFPDNIPHVLADDLVYETSIYTPEGNSAVHVQAAFNSNTVSSYAVFDSDNTVKFNNEVVGTWKGGRWYKAALVFHKDTGLADFYMNGMLVKEGSVIVDGTLDSLYRAKVTVIGDSTADVTAGFDEIKIYEGAYMPEDEKVFVSAPSMSEMDRVIFITEDIPMADIELDYGIVGIPTLYKDAQMDETADTAADGAVLAVKSEKGDNIDYYEFVDVTKRTFAGTVLTMQGNSNLSLCKNGTIKAQSIVGTAKPVRLFAAVYENGVLKSVKSAETSESGTLSAEILIDKEQEQTVKVMVWDGMKALNDGKNLGSAEKTE